VSGDSKTSVKGKRSTKRARPLQLKRIDAVQVDLRNRVGGGRSLRFPIDEQELCLVVGPMAPPSAHEHGDWLELRSPGGRLALAPGPAFLRVTSGIDWPGESDCGDAALRDCIRDRCIAGLPERLLRNLAIRGVAHAEPGQDDVRLGFEVRRESGSAVLAGTLAGPADRLLECMSEADWEAAGISGAALGGLRVRRPVLIGEARISRGDLRSLTAGDLVLPERPCFDRQGEGAIELGGIALEGCLFAEGSRFKFRFAEWRNTMEALHGHEDEELGTLDEDYEDAGYGNGEQAPLENLAVTLVFEAGVLNMRLAELQGLAPGSVIRLGGSMPPTVVIRCDGAQIGRGELVQLGDQLGVEVLSIDGPAR
jgi:type III secretion protein Q